MLDIQKNNADSLVKVKSIYTNLKTDLNLGQIIGHLGMITTGYISQKDSEDPEKIAWIADHVGDTLVTTDKIIQFILNLDAALME